MSESDPDKPIFESLELRSRSLRVAATGRFGVLAVMVIFISAMVVAALVR